MRSAIRFGSPICSVNGFTVRLGMWRIVWPWLPIALTWRGRRRPAASSSRTRAPYFVAECYVDGSEVLEIDLTRRAERVQFVTESGENS